VAWACAFWIFIWVGVFIWHASAAMQQIENAKAVENMILYRLNAPYIAPGPLIPVQRINPAIANIDRRYGAENEIDEIA
jgi:hypothetical protein